MKIPPQKEEKLKEHILEGRHLKLDFSTDPIRNLHSCVKVLIEPCHWGHNIRMNNKAEEKQRFLEKIEDEDRYIPDFKFREFRYDRELLLDILEQCIEAADRIEEEELERYGAEKVTPEDLQRFYRDIFREFRFFVELSAGIEREEKWRKYSEKIWPMVERTEFEKSREKMRDIETFEEEKDLDSSDLKQMFEDEIDRLGMEWEVEIREVSGCHNIPEEKTVVVADGEDEKRYYSGEEAKMLTVHELFHSVRAYNGYKASKDDLPPILAIHTPFYDKTEEGGALYRENKTGAAYSNKTYDHHLRLVTAYSMAKSEDLKEEFHGIAEDIIEMGADPERVFELMARNREALRHHIYKSGERAWEGAGQEQIDALLIGKINHEYAELFRKEAEAGGMMQEPAIGAEELFEFTFKDSEQT